MSATVEELESTLFQDPSFEEKVQRFATDSGCQVVYLTKERYRDMGTNEEFAEEVDGQETVKNTPLYSITYRLHLPPTPPHSLNTLSTLALIKSAPILYSLAPLGTQLHFVLLSASSAPPALTDEDGASGPSTAVTTPTAQSTPYDGLHSLVHWGVASWFDSYVDSKQAVVDHLPANKKGNEAAMGIPAAKKRFAELELSLLHLKQNVEIPETHLSVHPAIRKAVAGCRASGTRISVDTIEPQSLLSDPTFLNKLQSDVNSWVREVQAVTKLSRDVSSGTASQEINFWLSMEHALESIEAQLRGEEVTLALDILKHAKRFHATVSFIADTGLKEAADLGMSP